MADLQHTWCVSMAGTVERIGDVAIWAETATVLGFLDSASAAACV